MSVSGHLQEKNGRYHMVLNYQNEVGIWKQKWKSTGLVIKDNKTKAKDMLADAKKELEKLLENDISGAGINLLFSDYILNWLESMRNKVDASTFIGYHTVITNTIAPYFEKSGTKLVNLKAKDIAGFYTHAQSTKGIGGNTIKHYHANIRKCLQQAFKDELIQSNPADRVDLPKVEKYLASFYTLEELETLFETLEGHWIELPAVIAATYGLRRSEVLGLKWSAFDFNKNTFTIQHTVVWGLDEKTGKRILVKKNKGKTLSSLRSLPLMKDTAEKLLLYKEKQEYFKQLCGAAYSMTDKEYVFVDELGCLIKPDRVTHGFKIFLKKNSLPHIRFHDLRHSCASLQLNNGVSIKEIQLWLGHSTFSTTADIYSHLDSDKKTDQASLLEGLLFADKSQNLSNKQSQMET